MNPHRLGARYPFRGLCSAALAYKVAQAYQMRYGEAGLPLESLLDLVALATIADVVPLHDENRGFVREGLTQLSRGARCGIRALKQVAGVTRDCTAETIAFKLAPRLNAAGRLDHAMLGVQLLTTESPAEAQRLADRLEQLNRERQKIEAEMMSEAVATVKEQELPAAFVLASRHWHVGVVGIAAARLVERFHRSTTKAWERDRHARSADLICIKDWRCAGISLKRSAGIPARRGSQCVNPASMNFVVDLPQ
jgi:single-stranded-DNA-specific exonuclease